MELNQLPGGEFPTLGSGARGLLDILEIEVKIGPEFWSYTIRQGPKSHRTDTTCDLINNNEERARIEAVTEALKILGREDDPVAVSSGLTWVPL